MPSNRRQAHLKHVIIRITCLIMLQNGTEWRWSTAAGLRTSQRVDSKIEIQWKESIYFIQFLREMSWLRRSAYNRVDLYRGKGNRKKIQGSSKHFIRGHGHSESHPNLIPAHTMGPIILSCIISSVRFRGQASSQVDLGSFIRTGYTRSQKVEMRQLGQCMY